MSAAREAERGNLTFGIDNEETRARLRELMLFVAERCQDDPAFGLVKLNKILYFADFICFAKYGRSITGISYNKLPRGPVPTAAQTVRSGMERDEDIFITKSGYSPRSRQRVVPRREANLDLFKPQDIALVDGVIEALSGLGGGTVSELSHGRAWKAVRDFESIPYETTFVDDTPLTEDDVSVARQMIAEYEGFEGERGS